MQAELEQTYPRLGTIYSLCSVYYPNIRQRSDVLNRRNFLKTGFYEGINIGSSIEAPGVINHRGSSAGILFGELDGQESPRARRIVKIFRRAGIAIDLSPDVVKTLWTKLVVAASVAGITSAARVPAKRLLQYQEAGEKTVAAMREAEAVGLAKGVNLDGDVVERMMEALNHFRDNEKASMHTDLELGKPLELDALNGAVVRIGREVGVPTPIHSALCSILLAHKDGSLGGTS